MIKEFELGYFACISSGGKFQFFSAYFASKSCIDTRIDTFDRYTFPICGENIEKACRSSKMFFCGSMSKIVKILTWI